MVQQFDNNKPSQKPYSKPNSPALYQNNTDNRGGGIKLIDPSQSIKSFDVFSSHISSFINASAGNLGYSENQVLTAYLTSVYLHAAINRVANLIRRVNIVAEIEKDGQWVRLPETDRLNKILSKDGAEYLSRTWLNESIYGASVAYKVKTNRAVIADREGNPIYSYKDGAVAGIYVIDKPMWDANITTIYGDIDGVNVNRYNTTSDILKDRTYLTRKEFIYVTRWNPANPVRGTSLVSVCIHEAVANSAIAQWMAEYFTRGAMPFILVSSGEEDSMLMTDSDVLKLKRAFEDNWQGMDASLRAMVTDKKLSIEQVGISASEIGAPDLNDTALEGIATTIGLDRELIVTPSGGSHDRHADLIKRAWDDTVIPLAERYVEALARDFGLRDGMRLVIDLSEISELDADRDDRAGVEVSLFDSQLQAYNEARVRMKMPPVKELDGWYLHDGVLTPLDRIVSSGNLPTQRQQTYADWLWANDLALKSEVLRMLGHELPPGMPDGYRSDLEQSKQFALDAWNSDLALKSQTLRALNLPVPEGREFEDGYQSELERGADFAEQVKDLWREKLIKRGEARSLLDIEEGPKGVDGYIDEVGEQRSNVMELWGGNILKRSEVRQELGLPPDDNIIDGYADEVRVKLDKLMNHDTQRVERILEYYNNDLVKRDIVQDALSIPVDNTTTGYKRVANVLDDAYAQELMSKDNIEEANDGVRAIPDETLEPTDTPPSGFTHQGNRDDELDMLLEKTLGGSPDGQLTFNDYLGNQTLRTDGPIGAAEETLVIDNSDNDPLPLSPLYGGEVDIMPSSALPVADEVEGVTDEFEEWLDEQTLDIDTDNGSYYENIATQTDGTSENQELYLSLWIGDEERLIELQDQLSAELGDDTAIEWQRPDTFHITLGYALSADGDAEKHLMGLLPSELVPLNIYVSHIDIFDNPDATVIYASVELTDDLKALQASVITRMQALNLPLSQHSKISNFTPHITLAYAPPNTFVRRHETPMVIRPMGLYVSRGDYEVVNEVPFLTMLEDYSGKSFVKDDVKDMSEKWMSDVEKRELNALYIGYERSNLLHKLSRYIQDQQGFDVNQLPPPMQADLLEFVNDVSSSEQRIKDNISSGKYDGQIRLFDIKDVETTRKALAELNKWRKATLKHGINKGLRFETLHIDEVLADKVKSALVESAPDIEGIFAKIKQDLLGG